MYHQMRELYDYIDDNIYFIKLEVTEYNGSKVYLMTIDSEWVMISKQEYEYANLQQYIIWRFINIKQDHCEQ